MALAAARGVTSGLQVAGASAGAAAGALAAALSPMEIYGLVQQSHYADQLDKLAQESSAYGYEGDALLAQLYRDKTAAEGAVAGVSAVLSTVGAAVSIAAAASVVGAPVAVVTSLLTGALNGILRGVQQPIIEKLANDYARKIDELGGPQAYFEKNLQARHEQLANSDGLRKMLADLQAGWNASSVIGVQTTEISKSALELAAITGNADNLKSVDVFVDRFVQGERVAGQPVVLDVAAGGIDIASRKGERPALTFITPLAAPGEEQRRRTKTGKSEFTTFVEIVGKQDRWRIRDGAADTTIDLAKVVSQLVDANGVLKHSIKLDVIGGDGDDVVLANASRIHYDGGAGTNTVSYAALGRQDSITVSADGERFNVRKQLNNANVYREGVATQTTAYGKRTENVQYRHVELARVGQLVEVDTLEHVQHIIGGAGNDSITGNAHDNFLAGGSGDDRLDGGAGNDTLVGGEGQNTVIGGAGDDVFLQDLGVWSNQLDGGAGVDTVKYNVHQPSEERLERMGDTGIHADLQKGTVEKWPALNLFSVDHVKNIENLHGSRLNDRIAGDDQDNELWGHDGNDTIRGRGGDDILRGGLGLDTLYGEDGNDIFLQDDETVSDDIDGGAGLDTVDYSAMIHPGRIVAPHEYGFGIEADLSREWVRKASALGVDYYDNVRNVENVIGTSMKDVLIGDAQANTLMGQGGDDTVRGGDGDDLLFGGDGNDMLYGDAGNDTLYGGWATIPLKAARATIGSARRRRASMTCCAAEMGWIPSITARPARMPALPRVASGWASWLTWAPAASTSWARPAAAPTIRFPVSRTWWARNWPTASRAMRRPTCCAARVAPTCLRAARATMCCWAATATTSCRATPDAIACTAKPVTTGSSRMPPMPAICSTAATAAIPWISAARAGASTPAQRAYS